MTRLPAGDYLSPEQYRKRAGYRHVSSVYKAIKNGNLQSYIVDHSVLILSTATIRNNAIKTGKYIGLSAKRREQRGKLNERLAHAGLTRADITSKEDNDK